jgi:hypothetical protein
MRASRAAELAHVKQTAAKALESVAAEHDTLRQQCQILSGSYTDLEQRYLALVRAHTAGLAIERDLRAQIAALARPWYVRWFGLGDTA